MKNITWLGQYKNLTWSGRYKKHQMPRSVRKISLGSVSMTIINCTASVSKSWFCHVKKSSGPVSIKKITCLGQNEKGHLALSVITLSPALSASKTSPGSINKKKII